MKKLIFKFALLFLSVSLISLSSALHADDDTAQPDTDMTNNAAWENKVEGENAPVIPATSDAAQPNTGDTNNAAWENKVEGEAAEPNAAQPNVGDTDNAAEPNVDLSGY